MLVYYQDFGSTSNYRIQNYSESLAILTDRLHDGRFPAYAPGAAASAAAAPWRVGTGLGATKRFEIALPSVWDGKCGFGATMAGAIRAGLGWIGASLVMLE